MSSTPFELNNSLVRAGAGAGKTRGLVEKVVEVYRRFSGSPRIVVTTFTRKATQELKERLILRACADKDAAFLQFVSDPTKLQISTIHGLLNIFLKQVGHLAGLDAGFRILSEGEGEHLSKLALRETLLENGTSSPRWLEIYGFPRMLKMCRAFEIYRRESGALVPGTIQDLESIERAEQNRWRRILLELATEIEGEVDEPSWQEYAAALKLFAGDFTNYPTKPRRSKKQEHLEAWHERVEETSELYKKEMGKACWRVELWPGMVAEWEEFQTLAEDFGNRLRRLKDERATFEMIDLELKSLEILRDKPFLGAIFSEAWDFWMIDEYQDTSPLQVAILKALIGEKAKYIVGDPQQSIYLFRGAEVRVFEAAAKEIASSGGEVIELIKNYRSEPALLLWINDFMSSLSAGGFIRMEPRSKPENDKDSPAAVTLFRAESAESELRGLAVQIEKLLSAGARFENICVLGRTHRGLMEASRVLKDLGYPTHVHSSRGFNLRREVLDAQALWTFLINPHNNINLLILLRSPWFFVPDSLLSEWMKDRPHSLWRRLSVQSPDVESVARLKAGLEEASNVGLARAFEKLLVSNALLDLSLTNDPAGRKESNLWKILFKVQDLAKEGSSSLLDLLESEPADVLDANEGDATSAQEPNSINLMTIHGSKGLEFDHVLLPAMGESPRTSNTLPLGSDGKKFFFPIWIESEKEFVASPLDVQLLKRQRVRELEEFDRWLYVALTRAKKTLTLSWSKVERESWAERSSWFVKPEGRHNGPNYTVDVVTSFTEPQMYRGAARVEAKLRPKFYQTCEEEGDTHRSVTEITAKASSATKIESGDLLRRWQAQTLGSRIHRALESIKYGREPDLSGAEAEAVEFVLNAAEPNLKILISQGEAEWGFQIRTPRMVVEGQIDLWAKSNGRLFVLDYKTGSEKQKESAFQQLSLYAWALRKFGHLEPIEMVVIYPLQKKTDTRVFSDDLFMHWEREFGCT